MKEKIETTKNLIMRIEKIIKEGKILDYVLTEHDTEILKEEIHAEKEILKGLEEQIWQP